MNNLSPDKNAIPNRFQLRNQLLGAVIGLSGACLNHAKLAHTDSWILRALTASGDPGISREDLSSLIRQVKREKSLVAPMCESCASPCGSTSDYDMNRLLNAPEEISHLKLSLLLGIQALAPLALHLKHTKSVDDETFYFFHKALFVLSQDWEKDQLNDIILEMGEYCKILYQLLEDDSP